MEVNDNMDFEELQYAHEEFNNGISSWMEANTKPIDLTKVSDKRGFYGARFNENFIAVEGNVRDISYYGGFEYIDSEYITKMGNWTIFSRDESRVDEILNVQCDEGTDEEDAPSDQN